MPPAEQCRYVHERCAAHQTSLDIPYLRTYFCASTSARPAFFGALVGAQGTSSSTSTSTNLPVSPIEPSHSPLPSTTLPLSTIGT